MILLIASTNIHHTYGGGQVYFKNLVAEMVRQQINVVLACPGEGSESSYLGKPLYFFEPQPTEASIRALLTQLKPQVVHAHGYKALFAQVGHQLGIPVIITAHHGGILCPAGALLNHQDQICQVQASPQNCLPCVLKNIRGGQYAYPIMKNIPDKTRQKLSDINLQTPFVPYLTPVLGCSGSIANKLTEWQSIAQYATLMIAPSEAIAQAMQRNGMPTQKIKVIPHGIPLPLAKTKPTKQPNQPLNFFFLGRLNHVKGIHVMLEALHVIKKPFELHIIGEAVSKQEKRYLKQLQHQYPKDHRFIWHGGITSEAVFDTIKTMDCMIHPAIFLEVFGLNIAEALAVGLPVIATRCGGAEMQITHGVNGLLVPPNDTMALRQAILSVINQDITFNLSNNPVNSIANHVKVLENIYQWIK